MGVTFLATVIGLMMFTDCVPICIYFNDFDEHFQETILNPPHYTFNDPFPVFRNNKQL